MPLAPLKASPRTLNVPLAAAAVAPIRLRTEPFVPGQLVHALSAGAANLVGCALNRAAGYWAKFTVAKANVAGGAGIIGQTAAAREADGDVSGDLTIELGNAGGNILPAITALTAADADTHLTTIVMVNGVPYGRIADSATPNPGVGQWGWDSDNTYTLVIGASTGTDVLKVGTEIEIFVGLNIGNLAKVDASAAGGLAAGAALTAGVFEDRRLGLRVAGTDLMGRATAQLVNYDLVMSEVAATALISATK